MFKTSSTQLEKTSRRGLEDTWCLLGSTKLSKKIFSLFVARLPLKLTETSLSVATYKGVKVRKKLSFLDIFRQIEGDLIGKRNERW